MKSNKGITLTSLIVTIIVMVILAGIALLFSVGDSGAISRAEKTQFLEDMKLYKEELELYKSQKQIENQKLGVTPITTGLDINEWDYDDITINFRYIPSMKAKYAGKIGIQDGELAYFKVRMTSEEEKIAKAAGLIEYNEIAIIKVLVDGEGIVKINGEELAEEIINSSVGAIINLNAESISKQVGDKTVEYVFSGWYEDGKLISLDTNYNYEVKGSAEITARFGANATLIYYLENGEEKVLIDESTTLSGYKDRTDIIKVEVGSQCNTIGTDAFYGCTELTQIVVLNNVNIGYHAFMNCTKLETINLPKAVLLNDNNGVQFKNCTNLNEFIIGSIGNPVDFIPSQVFNICNQSDLVIKVYVKNGITNLPNESWGAANSTIEYYSAQSGELVNIILGQRYKGNTEIAWTEIPNADVITKIKGGAFQGCTNLALTELPKNVVEIGGSAFYGCEKLAITKISEKISKIGAYSFHGSGLKEIFILGNTNIGDHAFMNCKDLKLVNIPKANLSAGGIQFKLCTGLNNITIGSVGNPVSSIPSNTFLEVGQGNLTVKVYVEKSIINLPNEPWGATNSTIEYYSAENGELINMSLGQRYLGNTEITWEKIPDLDKITKIKAGAFSGCIGLKGTSLPPNVVEIGNSAFSGCTGLTLTSIPAKITSIGSYAFNGCTGLIQMTTLGNTIIGDHAFEGCANLTNVNLPKATLASGGVQFKNCKKLNKITIGSAENKLSLMPDNIFWGCSQNNFTIEIYVESGITSLANAPWGASGAKIVYLDSTAEE